MSIESIAPNIVPQVAHPSLQGHAVLIAEVVWLSLCPVGPAGLSVGLLPNKPSLLSEVGQTGPVIQLTGK